MKIRQELSPAMRRIVAASSVGLILLIWFVLTLPLLPPLPARTPPPEVVPREGQLGASEAANTAADALLDERAAGGSYHVDAPPSGSRPIVPASILPSPQAVLAALVKLHTDEALVRSAAMSFYRITTSFLLAALVAIPLGILMGAYPPVRTAVEPFSGPLRYLPISAVTGLFILLFGIEENMKLAFLFTGTVVYLLPIVVETIQNVDDIYLETAYTLGANQWQAISRVLVPAAWPGIFEACRVIYGIGWTYVILAELINAEYGLGHLIQIAYKRGHIDQAYALVLVILLLGIASNEAFRFGAKRLFTWREA
jgi:NitT/TauT family transport system permease protein